MAESTAHICDELLPGVPLRQWVLTLPHPVRYLVAYDPKLFTKVIGITMRAIFAHLREVARRELHLSKGARIECGGVCVPQRFNSALALSPHLHALATA